MEKKKELIKRVIVKDISKKFLIGFKANQRALARAISIFSGREQKKIIEVLRGISFDVENGKILGVVGKNGAGKSTLLRIIAGIYRQDSGEIVLNGKIVSLIGLNFGIIDRLDLEDNVYLLASLLGQTKKETREKFDSIVKFAELENFVGTKLYQFSLGMIQRLVFSVAIHSNPEILLLDEVFEVGDEKFRRKSANKIRELVGDGASVILVSNELDMIRKYCDEIVWIEDGKIKKKGKAKDILMEYRKNGGEND